MQPVKYVTSNEIRQSCFSRRLNHWDSYFAEIMSQLGAPAQGLGLGEFLACHSVKSETKVLLIGQIVEGELANKDIDIIYDWILSGGILIGCGTNYMDSIFGNNHIGKTCQKDDYEKTGYAALKYPGAELRQFGSSDLLPVFSDISLVECVQSESMADLFDTDKRLIPYPAVTRRSAGRGFAYYISFSIPQTVWVLHQGTPVDPAGTDICGTRYCKTSSLFKLEQDSGGIPYADELLLLLQYMISHCPIPFVDQLPPDGENIIDGAFYWGGDDEFIPGTQVFASDWMKEQGLPYHVNTLWDKGRFSITTEEKARINANGHEVSLHYNFISNNKPPYLFTREDVERQYADYVTWFGEKPVTSVIHYTLWNGWSEPAEWMSFCGAKGDNSFYYHFSDAEPMFPAGTAFPFFFYTDWKSGHRRLEFIEQSITGFELGYIHCSTGPKDESIDVKAIHRAVDIAVQYHCFINMFYHAYRIRDWAGARNSIKEVLRYISASGKRIMHLANDVLSEWWLSRDSLSISDYRQEKNRVSFTVSGNCAGGVVIKIPVPGNCRIIVDGMEKKHELKHESGRKWAWFVIPVDSTRIIVEN